MDARTILDAIRFLQAHGYDVAVADIPCLYFVNGREITAGQLIGLATQLATQTAR